MRRETTQTWTWVYLLVPLTLGLMVLIRSAALSPVGEKIMQLMLVMLIFKLVAFWMRSHHAELLGEAEPGMQQTRQHRESSWSPVQSMQVPPDAVPTGE